MMFDITADELNALHTQADSQTQNRHFSELVKLMNEEFRNVKERLIAGQRVDEARIRAEIPGATDDYNKMLALRLVRELNSEGFAGARMSFNEASDDGPGRYCGSSTWVHVKVAGGVRPSR